MSDEIVEKEETLFEFPCQYGIKAMGKFTNELDITVMEIVSRHAPDTHNHKVQKKPSKDGNYVSITVTIEAQSKKQLDAIYQDLVDHPHVLYAL